MDLIKHLDSFKYKINEFLIYHESGRDYNEKNIKLQKRAWLLYVLALIPTIVAIIYPLLIIRSLILTGSLFMIVGSTLLFFIEEGKIIPGLELSNWQFVKKEYNIKKYFGWSFIVIGSLIIFVTNLCMILASDP